MRASVTLVAVAAALLVATAVGERRADAEIIAAYVGGYGGLSSNSGDESANGSGLDPGLGFQIGARVLIFDAYLDRTAFGGGKTTTRGILGLRMGLGLAGGMRLVLRGGAGVLLDEGGALAAPESGTAGRRGLVARAGIALEKRLAPKVFWVGLGLDGEVYSLESPTGSVVSGRTDGGDVLISLEIKFELGL